MSNRQMTLALALGLAALVRPAALAEFYDIADSAKGSLAVVDGKVYLARYGDPGPFKGWTLSGRGGTGWIRVISRDKWDDCYVAFDPDGKDPKVTLASKPGPGTKWRRTHVKGTAASYTIQATTGKYKGWYLDAGQAHTLKDKNGKKFTAYEAVLVKEPKKPLKFSIYEVAP
jgi:hypothetical protein